MASHTDPHWWLHNASIAARKGRLDACAESLRRVLELADNPLRDAPVYEMPVFRLKHPRYPHINFYVAGPSRRAAYAWAQQDDPMWQDSPITIEQTSWMSAHTRPHFVPSNIGA